MMNYTHCLNKIKNHGGLILETRENFLIIWQNPIGTVVRADYFDENGMFEGRQILTRP